jgi:hypothetical protein
VDDLDAALAEAAERDRPIAHLARADRAGAHTADQVADHRDQLVGAQAVRAADDGRHHAPAAERDRQPDVHRVRRCEDAVAEMAVDLRHLGGRLDDRADEERRQHRPIGRRAIRVQRGEVRDDPARVHPVLQVVVGDLAFRPRHQLARDPPQGGRRIARRGRPARRRALGARHVGLRHRPARPRAGHRVEIDAARRGGPPRARGGAGR